MFIIKTRLIQLVLQAGLRKIKSDLTEWSSNTPNQLYVNSYRAYY